MYRAPLETRVSLTLSRHSARTSESTAPGGSEPCRAPGGSECSAPAGGARSASAQVGWRAARAAWASRRPSRGRSGPRSAAGSWACWVLRAAASELRARHGTS